MYISKSQLVSLLTQTGVAVRGNKVNRTDFRHVFGARYVEPEWMLLTDYDVETPEIYLNFIQNEESKLGRSVLPSTYSLAKFGDFATATGNQCCLLAVVYQYSLNGNPRNVHYAYRLFLGSKGVSKNSGFGSLHEVKNECTKEAKNIVETQLFDLT